MEKARTLIGYQPDTPFDQGLDTTVRWFRDNWDRIHSAASFAPGMSSAVRQMLVLRDGLPVDKSSH